jgi:mRNA interferase MazF
MNRGEVWWVQFAATVGSEVTKTRPAIIVSNNVSNRYMPRVQVIPLTSHTGRLYPSEALVTVAGTQSKAMADQIATADKSRLKKILGKLSAQDMQAVDRVIRIQLGIPL